jgi:hypothetical protein
MHYYFEELPEEIMNILREDTDDPLLTSQDYQTNPTPSEIADVINLMCRQGAVVVFESHGVIILLTRKNAYIGNFDTHLSSKATARDTIRAYKEFFDWLPVGTQYLRVETRTPLEKYAKVMTKAVGATIDGVMKNSYRTKDNKMVNEYVVGYNINRETESCQ